MKIENKIVYPKLRFFFLEQYVQNATVMSGGEMKAGVLHPIQVFLAKTELGAQLKIRHKSNNTEFRNSWEAMLQNLEPGIHLKI